MDVTRDRAIVIAGAKLESWKEARLLLVIAMVVAGMLWRLAVTVMLLRKKGVQRAAARLLFAELGLLLLLAMIISLTGQQLVRNFDG